MVDSEGIGAAETRAVATRLDEIEAAILRLRDEKPYTNPPAPPEGVTLEDINTWYIARGRAYERADIPPSPPGKPTAQTILACERFQAAREWGVATRALRLAAAEVRASRLPVLLRSGEGVAATYVSLCCDECHYAFPKYAALEPDGTLLCLCAECADEAAFKSGVEVARAEAFATILLQAPSVEGSEADEG